MVALASVQIGPALSSDRLTVFPLFQKCDSSVQYRLAEEALADGTALVEEISAGGSVPELAVSNLSDTMVLFLEGQELRGAKQNRVLNTSVLIAAKTKTVLPVSCVEQGRWRHTSKHFYASDCHSSPKLRSVLKASVAASARSGSGHGSDQYAVWQEVSRQMSALGAASPTMAMSDTFIAHKPYTDKVTTAIDYPEGASGLAVAVGGQVVAVDLFDNPTTCHKVWQRMIGGIALEAIEARNTREIPRDEVQATLNKLGGLSWQTVPAAGVGEEHRAQSEDNWHGSQLTLAGTLIHMSLVLAS